MGWSFRIIQIVGIDIKIHVTFALILLLGAWQWGQPFGLGGALFGVTLMLLLFLCVTLHELGHSLVARRFGIKTREIVLLPLGGVALLEQTPRRPLHELLIAVAGPLVNLVIAGVLLAAVAAMTAAGALDLSQLLALSAGPPSLGGLLLWLLQANLALALFNLIPAFPLDGGRMLRAVLAMFTTQQRATQVATLVGRGLALLLGVAGLLSGNILLALVAGVIFLGAGQELRTGQVRTVLTTLLVGDAYNKYALTLSADDRISRVVDYILTSYQPDYAVVQGGRLIGIVSRDDVLRALESGPEDSFVAGFMRRQIVKVDARQTLDEVRATMAAQSARVVAVYAGERYLGLVSIEDIAEAFTVITFLERQKQLRQSQGLPAPLLEHVMPQAAPPVAAPVAATPVMVAEPLPALTPEEQTRTDVLGARRRRLAVLEMQQRHLGARTSPDMVAEIERLRATISELEGA